MDNNYEQFIEECRAIIVEAVFTSRWAMIEGYWKLGQRILEEKEEVKRVAESLQKSERTIQYAVQFAEKFPDINTLPDGKNISWRKVIALLPSEHKEQEVDQCEHKWVCCKCHKVKE